MRRVVGQSRSRQLATEQLVADYARPDAIMVPHYCCDITSLLETIATRIAKTCGVILLSQDPAFSEAFVATQKTPQHFSIVSANLDTPWIRDRSPIAIQTSKGIRWCHSAVEDMGRPNDDRLFQQLSKKKLDRSSLKYLAQGNLIAASQGLAFSTRLILSKNEVTQAQLKQHQTDLGINAWLLFSGFKNEITGHADVHLRVLKRRLIAVAWNLSVKADRESIRRLIQQIHKHDPRIKIIKIPIRSRGKQYASLVNWIQIGKRLLVPRYHLTEKQDIEQTNITLKQQGFITEYIYSPTLEMAGSLHCLTASIYSTK